jgi:protein-S-isoprenylcysteine O-methyltransferase Ste14
MAKKSANITEQSSMAETFNPATRKTLPGDSAWTVGLTTLVVLLVGIFLLRDNYNSGRAWFNTELMAAPTQTALGIVILAFVAMAIAETWRWRNFDSLVSFRKAPVYDVRFFAMGLLRFLEHLALLWLIQLFYQTADEYGFANKHPFYQPWHQLLDVFFSAYIWLGLPYLLLMRSFKWHEQVEQRDYGLLLELGFWSLMKRLPRTSHWLNQDKVAAIPGKSIFLDLLVKMFFLPLMFVFFNDQLSHLINNLNYLAAGMPKAFVDGQWQHSQWNFDAANLITSLLFTLHTGLAFCAIALSQRWLPQLANANPRLGGWLACLLSFPPFIHMIVTSQIPGVTGPHLDGPSPILAQLPNLWIFTLAIFLMGFFYALYLITTISLGVNYSELTRRDIVRTGPYACVRHPAYACKLLGWLCVLTPLIGLNMFDGNWMVAGGLSGAYVISAAIYFGRAMTEEQQLSEDPDYRDYCSRVRRRFIPGVW